jgi:hypothetical protein
MSLELAQGCSGRLQYGVQPTESHGVHETAKTKDHGVDLELGKGEILDQGGAKWIVIKTSLWGHNDTPCRRPAPGRPIGRPGSGRPQGVIGGLGTIN